MSDQEPIELKPPAEDAGSQALSEALRSSFVIVRILMFVLIVLFLGSGTFVVKPQQNAIILRLGKPVGEGKAALLGPGIHFSWPKPLDEHVSIPITSLQAADSTVGWYVPVEEMNKGQEPQPMQSLNPANVGYALTSDTNIIHINAHLLYHISDPIRFYFDFANAAVFVTNALNNAILYASAHFTVDEILSHKDGVSRAISARVNELIEQQQLGITADQLDFQAVPPRILQNKFNEVTQATVKSGETRNKAESYANDTVSKARAEAESRINTAQAKRQRLVDIVQAEQKNFTDMLPQYEANPELFLQIRQMAALDRILANAKDKIIQPHSNSRELRLQLSREPKLPTAATNSLAQ